MTKHFRVELINDLMTLLDGENNGRDAYVLHS